MQSTKRRLSLIVGLLLLTLGLAAGRLEAATYYIAPGGSDGAACSLAAPCATFNHVVNSVASAGDTVLVRGGDYVENVVITASGTNWTTGSGAITVTNYPSEVPWIKPSSGICALAFQNGSAVAYHIWTGINVDGINLTGAADPAIYIGHDANHIRYQHAEIKDSYWTAIGMFQGPYLEILDNLIHDGGRVGTTGGADASHGVYISGFSGAPTGTDSHILVEGNNIYGFTAHSLDSGIQIYTGATDTDQDGGTIIRRNHVHDNSYGMFLGEAATVPIQVYANLVRSNAASGLVLYARLHGAKIFNNTVYGNGDHGIDVGAGGDVLSSVIKNNAVTNSSGSPITVWNVDPTQSATIEFNGINGNGGSNTIDDQNGLSTISGNITTVPSYTDTGTADFTLQATSAYIIAGTDLSAAGVDVDFTGTAWTVPYDIGAYKFTAVVEGTGGDITFVSRVEGGGTGADTSIVSPSQAHTAGNGLIALADVIFGSGTGTGVTNTGADTWTRLGFFENATIFNRYEIWYTSNTNGNAADVVTVALDASTPFREVVVLEVTGQDKTDMGGSVSSGHGTGTDLVSGTLTVGTLHRFIAAIMSSNGGALTAGSGYTLASFGSNYADEYKSVTASEATTATSASSDDWAIFAGSFKAAVIVPGPAVSDVSSTTSNGTYSTGDTITITVTFADTIVVTGTPQIQLETGAPVNCGSASGAVLTCTYTVGAGDTSGDLDYLSTSALNLNGGTIQDGSGNNAVLTLASPGATHSLGANKALVISAAPVATSFLRTLQGDRVRLNTSAGPCVFLAGAGSPEGVQTATCGTYLDTTNRVVWTKVSGTGNTGWSVGFNANATINGTLTVGTINGQTISSSANLTGTLAVASTVTGGTYNGQTITSAANFTGSLTTGGVLTVPGWKTGVTGATSYLYGHGGTVAVLSHDTGGSNSIYSGGSNGLIFTSAAGSNIGSLSDGGALSVNGQVTALAARFTGGITGGSGPGPEMQYITSGGGYALLDAYNRTSAAYVPLHVDGSTLSVDIAGTTTVTVNGSGIVGIGTTSPDSGAKLHVVGGILTSSNFASTTGSSGGLDYNAGATRLFSVGTSGSTKGAFTWLQKGADNSSLAALELTAAGSLGSPDYASQATDWRQTKAGALDERYIYTDELHAKAFIADLEQALAGGQIISKSVAELQSNFACPSAAGTATLYVNDLPSAADMQVFQANDYVVVRSFSRSGGSLTIGDCVGVVTSPDTSPSGYQSWTFTRGSGGNAGAMTGGTVVDAKSLVLDYGVSGNGYHEVNAIDGANAVNSPYAQVVTWATSPVAANRTVRTRIGNLVGITGVSGEYGALLGTYSGSPTGSTQYVRAGTNGLDIVGGDLSLYDGSTKTVFIDHSTPSIAVGAAVPSFSTGAGIWMGKDSGAYKFRIGSGTSATSKFLAWDSSALTLANAQVDLYESGTLRLRLDPSVPSFALGASVPSAYGTGTGVWMGNDSGTYKFRVGDPSGDLMAWNGSSLSLTGAIIAASGAIGGFNIGADYVRDAANSFGLASTVTGGDDVRFWAGDTFANRATAPFHLTEAGALTATSATITGTVTASAGAIGGFNLGSDYIRDAANSFGLKSTVTGGNDCRFWAGDTFANCATAPFHVMEDGAFAATSGVVGGFTVASNALFSGGGGNRAGLGVDGSFASAFWAGSTNPDAAPFMVSHSGSLTATDVSLTAGAVTLNSSGVSIGTGTSASNKLKFAGGSTINEFILSGSTYLSLVAPDVMEFTATSLAMPSLAGGGSYVCVDGFGFLYSSASCP